MAELRSKPEPPPPPDLSLAFKQRVIAWAGRAADDDFRRRLSHLARGCNEFGYDPFGFNPSEAGPALLLARWVYRHYFRATVHGIENVPDGRVILAANHSGQLPFDGLCIVSALAFDRDPPRLARAMIEKWIPRLPFASYLFPRWGQILGTPENCRRALGNGDAILVFPEGVKGISKPFTQRYQLQPFGFGFLRLALETRTPVVPVAVVGAEEQAPAFNCRPLARALGWPAFPITPLPPFLPIVPLPTKYRIYFGEPLQFEGDEDDDDAAIYQHVRAVEHAIQSMLRVGLRTRKHVFW